MRFSQRMGVTPVKTALQRESMDDGLRNGVWNALEAFCWSKRAERAYGHSSGSDTTKGGVFFYFLWRDFYKQPVDAIPHRPAERMSTVRAWFFGSEWHQVYDFLEFAANNFPFDYPDQEEFLKFCNDMLERELSAYRFVGGIVTPITSQEEMAAIEHALSTADRFKAARTHLERALALLSDRKAPDYRNSIKESISAVEATCRILAGKEKAKLGDALAELERKQRLHTALRKAFDSLYGYTSDADGIRHALLEESSLDFDDAKFMLVCCSAFVNFLVAKTAE
jgi:hypothetical protein